MLRRAVLSLSLLTAFSLSAALGPGAELPVAPPVNHFLADSQQTVAVATDRTDFLALWRDETPGREGIYATVASEDGTIRPAVPLPLLRGGYVDVDVVWTGSSYLVALTRYLEPSLVVLVDRDGQAVSPLRQIDISISALAWNGERALAIVADPAGTRAALLDAEGNVIRSGIRLPAGIHLIQVAAAGDAFIAVWTEQLPAAPEKYRVHAIRISNGAAVSAPVELAEIDGYPAIEIASGGGEAGVVVSTGTAVGMVIRRYTIAASFEIDAEAPLALKPYVTSNVDVVATPRGFVATYFGINNDELKTIAFGSTTPQTIDLPWSPGSGIHTISNGRAVMAFWGIYPARAAAFDASLTQLASNIFPVPAAPVRQERPVIAGAGDGGMVAWVELGTLKLRRLDREGASPGTEPVAIATTVDSYFRPALAYTGRLWLVAWVDSATGVKVQRVSPEGALIGEPLSLDQPMGDLALASNGSVAALVMSSGVNRQGIRLIRFTADGERLDSAPIMLTDVRSADYPAIASNGDGFLAVWSRSLGYTPHLYGKRLDASGNPIEAEPIAIANEPSHSQSGAQVASNGTDYAVTYVRYGEVVIYDPPMPDDPRPEPARVFTKRVLASGVLADTTAQQDGNFIALGTTPAIAADGQRYVVTFRREDRDTLWLFAAPLDAQARRTNAPRLLLAAESHEQDHAVAAFGGAIWTAYSRIAPELASVQRVFLREVTEQTQGRRRGARN